MDNKIIIRTASAADAPALLKIYSPYVENTAITFEYDVPSTEEFASRIQHTLRKYPYLVAEEKGTLLGYAYAGPFHERPAYDWAVETSIYVDQSLKHRGIGRRLHDALETALREQGILNMNACIAYPPKEDEINKPYKEVEMEVSNPLFAIAYKDTEDLKENREQIVAKHIAIEIILNMIIGKSSELYKELYENGDLLAEPSLDYEFSDEYAHIIISGQSKSPEKIQEKIKEVVRKYKENGLDSEHFNRIKKKIYGDYVVEYNSVSDIARMFLADKMKKINSFDYIEEYNTVTKEYTEEVLKNVFKEDKMVLSVIKCKNEK